MDEEKRTVKILISFISDGDAVPRLADVEEQERPFNPAARSQVSKYDLFKNWLKQCPLLMKKAPVKKTVWQTRNHKGKTFNVFSVIPDGSAHGIPEHGMLLKIARKVRPDHLILLYSNDFKASDKCSIVEDNLEKLRSDPDQFGLCQAHTVQLSELQDPTDFDELRRVVPKRVNNELEMICQSCQDESGKPPVKFELFINAASGTAQMITILYSAVNFKNIPAPKLGMIPEERRYEQINFFGVPHWNETKEWKKLDFSKQDDGKVFAQAVADLFEHETHEFKLDFLSEASAFERLRDAATKYDFILIEDRCRELWENRSGDGKALAFVLWRVSHAAQLADQMNFGENINAETAPGDFEHESAVSVMNHLQKYLKNGDGKDLKNRPELKDLLEWTKDYRKLLSALVTSQSRKEKHDVVAEDESNLMELYLNIHRCLIRREYTDVLARYYRLVEGIMYLVLRKRHSFDARNPAATNLKSRGEYSKLSATYTDLFGEELDKYHSGEKEDKVFEDEFYPKQGKVSLGFYASYKLLRCYDQLRCDPDYYPRDRVDFGERFFNSSLLTEKSIVSDGKKFTVVEKMDEIRKQRNGTIAAHGMSPVEREDAEEAYSVLTALMRRMYQMNYIGNPDADPIMSALHLRSFIDVLEKV